MTGLAEQSDSEQLAAALRRIRGVDVSEAQLRAHEMRPSNLDGVNSDRGRLDLPEPSGPSVQASAPSVEITEAIPALHLHYRLEVDGFITALKSALQNEVAGYSLRLNERGRRIRAVDWNWAKEPQDTAEGWTTHIRMHVASLSKQITAIAITKLLDNQGIPSDAKIIDYLPAYWSKGPNVDQITFANLMTHTSGLDYGNNSSASDFQFMKAQIAAGTSHLGQYWYQNMNFGLCRILLATINGNIPVDFSPAAVRPERVQRHRLGCHHAGGVRVLRRHGGVHAVRRLGADPISPAVGCAGLQLPGLRLGLELWRSDHDGRRGRLAHGS